MKYKKCERCDLNWIALDEELCSECAKALVIHKQTAVAGNGVGMITEPVMLIRINNTYRDNISPIDLYNRTRGVWKVGERRKSAMYAFSVFQGVVLEVYKISYWEPASYYAPFTKEWDLTDRWQFVGEVDVELSKKYKNKSVKNYLKKGCVSPTIYVNC